MVSCFWLAVSCFPCLVSCFLFLAPCLRFLVSWFLLLMFHVLLLVLCFMFLFLRLSRPGLDGLSSLALLFDILNEEHRDCWLAASSWYL